MNVIMRITKQQLAVMIEQEVSNALLEAATDKLRRNLKEAPEHGKMADLSKPEWSWLKDPAFADADKSRQDEELADAAGVLYDVLKRRGFLAADVDETECVEAIADCLIGTIGM